MKNSSETLTDFETKIGFGMSSITISHYIVQSYVETFLYLRKLSLLQAFSIFVHNYREMHVIPISIHNRI